jgi:hypothetical protein
MLVGMNKSEGARARWQRMIEQQEASGLTIAAFCRRRHVPEASFYAWRWKLRAGVPPRRPGETFVEVKIAPEPAAEPSALELRLLNGRCVLVRAGFDRRTLLELLATLETDR